MARTSVIGKFTTTVLTIHSIHPCIVFESESKHGVISVDIARASIAPNLCRSVHGLIY
jgi:hypothetical protein